MSSSSNRLGRYEVLRELGRGAMGVVYLAKDPLIGRLVALKTFQLSYAADSEELRQLRSRFIREAQSAGILSQHPGIVTIHDVAEAGGGGGAFIAMEYVEGTNLKDILRRGDPVDLPFIGDIVGQIADALDYAHSKGVVHRDVKPANVLITPDKQTKIADFGIARINTSNLTQDGQMLGTPNYMAPEQVQGQEVDHRADIFSLGVIVYELLTRKKPFQGENLTTVTHRIVYDEFTPLEEHVAGLPSGLTQVLGKALEKSPARRYDAAGELAVELRRVIDEHLGTAPSPAAPSKPVPATPAAAPVAPTVTPSLPESRPAAASAPPSKTAATTLWGERLRQLLPVSGGDRGRRVKVGAVAAGAALLVFGALVLWARGQIPEVPPEDSQHRMRAQYLTLMKEGRRHLAAGRAGAASQAFRRAERLAPDPARVRALANDARRSVDEGELLATQLEAARQALEDKRYLEARASATAVLELDPDHAEAAEILAAATDALERETAASTAVTSPGRQPVTPRRRPSTMRSPTNRRPATAPQAVAPATMAIEFTTDLPEGTLVITANGEEVYRRAFAFYEKGGLFRKKKIPQSGKITAPPVRVPAGQQRLRVEVSRPEAPALVREARTTLPAGGSVRFRIRLAADGSLGLQID
ncbi:MAG: serine/threonine-protein kinase [Acidobacteriota bacterium]